MNELFFLKPAADFCESLLIGNGRLGAIVYGGVDEDVYELNDDTLQELRTIALRCVLRSKV